MKILSVIPARAGSKGIPNKNIRIVSGHPLIFYAIQNAINSEYITDIVVSTDPPEVGIIAKGSRSGGAMPPCAAMRQRWMP